MNSDDIKHTVYKIFGLLDDEEELYCEEHSAFMRRDSITDFLNKDLIDASDTTYVNRMKRIERSLEEKDVKRGIFL